jgi:DnaJ-class molecular chaperone
MKSFGKLLVVIGAILLLVSIPTAVILMLVGFIMFIVGKDKKIEVEAEARKDQERPCPFCKEPVLKSAVKCKHCHSDIPAIVNEPPLNDLIKIENGLWECGKCHTKMLLAGNYCSKCRGNKRDIAIRE